VPVHLGFANFYRRFIPNYPKVTAPISNLVMTQGSRKRDSPHGAEVEFRMLQKPFTQAPFLQQSNQQKTISLQTDASGFAIAGIPIL
jgi:hypothetical protein